MVLNTLDFLTKKDLETMKKYRFKGSEMTFLDKYLYEPFWDWIAQRLPRTLAPNVITLTGFLMPLMLGIVLL